MRARVPRWVPIVSGMLLLAGIAGVRDAAAQRLVVVNKSASTLSVVDLPSRREVAMAPTGFAPHEVAVSVDARYAFVSDYGTGERAGNTVTVIDLATAAALGTIDLGEHTRPHGIVVAGDGTVWVTTEGSRHVLQLDPAARRVVRAVRTGQEVTHQVVVVDAADRVYTANIGSGTVTAIDAGSGVVLGHVPTGAGAEGIAVSPDGTKVYVANREAGTLSEVDVATNRVVRSLAVGDFPIRVKVRPDGREALVSNARGNEVVAVDLGRWVVDRRLAVGAMPVGILITPDNRTAYVANTQDDKISVIDLVHWRLDGEIVAGDEPDGMAWVPR